MEAKGKCSKAPGHRRGASTDQGPHTGHLGEGDSYLGPDLAEPTMTTSPNLDRVERLTGASHWARHGEAERVTQLLADFIGPAQPG